MGSLTDALVGSFLADAQMLLVGSSYEVRSIAWSLLTPCGCQSMRVQIRLCRPSWTFESGSLTFSISLTVHVLLLSYVLLFVLSMCAVLPGRVCAAAV